MSKLVLCATIISVVLANRVTYRRNVIFTLKPGKATCFVKTVEQFSIIKANYQVIEKGGVMCNQTVSFEAQAGGGVGVERKEGAARWPAAALALHVPLTGQYRFCFDNTFDDQNQKTILFKLFIHTRNKTKRNNKERKQRRLIPGIKSMILDPMFPEPPQNDVPEIMLTKLLNPDDNIYTWKEKKYNNNIMRWTDYSNILTIKNNDEDKALREEIKHSKEFPDRVAPEKSTLEYLEDPDDLDDEDPNGPSDDEEDVVLNVYETDGFPGSRSWLPYRWDMIEYA